jgi:predicted NBD/HSP70 family sugar kinase
MNKERIETWELSVEEVSIPVLGGDLMGHAAGRSENKIVAISTRSPGQQLENQGADLGTVRKFNRRLILNYLREQGPTPRVTIAGNLGLSRATVSSIIDELKKDGLVHEGAKLVAAHRGGRRATWVHFNADAGYVIGIDIGRSHLIIRLTNLEAKTINKWRGPFDTKRGGKEGLEFVANRLHELVENNGIMWDQIRGIGLGIPGAPDPTFRMMISPPLLSDWGNIDIPAYLRRKLKLKRYIPIYLDNDANMGALGESRYGEGRGIADMIYVKVGTGIGIGLILNGQLYRGSRGVAGEFGHIIINEESPPCSSCGKRGCLEALSGVRAIVEDARQGISLSRICREAGMTVVSTPPVLAGYTNEIDIADVVREADEGDAASRAALETAGKRIGMAIGSYLINVYNPAMILLDGGAVRVDERGAVRINEPLLAALRQNAEASALPAAWAGTEILTGQLGDSAIALGAVATVIDRDEEFGALNVGARGESLQLG